MSEPAPTTIVPPAQFAVDIKGVHFAYRAARHPVLAIDEWQVQRGERVFLFGPSGSGKSTLLTLLAGIHTPNRGQVEVLGERLSSMNGPERDRFRARHIGLVFQQFNLIPWLSVYDNIALAYRFARHSTGKGQLADRMRELLDKLRLNQSLLKRRTAELSVGQQQRVAIARALINEPQLIIADEPTSSLDMDARDDFMDLLISSLNVHGPTLIFVSHDRSLSRHFQRQVDLRQLNIVSEATDAG